MKCQHKHHGKKYGKSLGKCKVHKVELLCKPFNCGVCLQCSPELNEKCASCKASRLDCCC